MNKMKLKFKIQGELFIKNNSSAFPLESNEYIEFTGMKTKIINNLNDLEGLVKINEPSHALNFVRIITSPRSFYILNRTKESDVLEIIDRQNIDEYLVFGDINLEKVLKNSKNGRYCICDEKIFKTHNIPIANVIFKDDAFFVKRAIIRKNKRNNNFKMSIIEEKITKNGLYSIISDKIIHDSYSKWSFPMFE